MNKPTKLILKNFIRKWRAGEMVKLVKGQWKQAVSFLVASRLGKAERRLGSGCCAGLSLPFL